MKKNSIKKKILSITLIIILFGNAVRITSTVPDSIVNALDNVVYAESNFESDFRLPENSSYSFENASILTINNRIEDINLNPENIRKIKSALDKRGSPMADQAYFFEKMAVKYDLPYNLLPAIAVIESGAGKHNYRPFNYAGMGGQGNAITFDNYEQAIEKHAQIIRYGYFDGGADTPEKIEQYYCFQCPTWGEKVTSVMYEIDGQ